MKFILVVLLLMMFNKPNSGLPSQHRNRANVKVPNLIRKINKALGFPKTSKFLWQVENIKGIRADVEGNGDVIKGIEADVQGIEADVQGIEADVQGIEADVQGIEADIATNAQTIANITTNTASNLTDIREKIEGNTVDIATNVIDIEKNVVNMSIHDAIITNNTAAIEHNHDSIEGNTAEIANNAAKISNNTADVCSYHTCTGQGTCQDDGACLCNAGYGGADCSISISSLIFVARGNFQKTVQVVDMVGSATCSDLAPYPLDPTTGGGGLLENTPVLCGGLLLNTECYSYDKASTTWQLLGNLVTGRRLFGAAIFKGALWVTGGYDNVNSLDSTEIIALDGTVTSGTNLPIGRYGHCMVVINNNEFMILGSSRSSNQYRTTMTYNANSETFSSGPSMLRDRRYAACSMFQSKLHNDRQVVLCAGGFIDQGTAELLDFSQENAQWTEAANLPQTSQIYTGARSMPSLTGDGVYLRADEYLFLFTCDESSCQWTTLKEGLQRAWHGVMMPLPSDYTCE